MGYLSADFQAMSGGGVPDACAIVTDGQEHVPFVYRKCTIVIGSYVLPMQDGKPNPQI